MKKYKKSPLKQNTEVTSDAEKAAKDLLGETAMLRALAKGGTKDITVETKIPKRTEKEAYALRGPEYKNMNFAEYQKVMRADPLYGTSGGVRTETKKVKEPDIVVEKPLYEAQYAQGQPIWEQRQQERSQRASGRRAARLAGKAARIQERLDSSKMSDAKRARLEEKKKQVTRSQEAAAKAAENQAKALEAGVGLRGKAQIEDKVVTKGQLTKEEQEALMMGEVDWQSLGAAVKSPFNMKYAHSPNYMYKNPSSPAKMWGANKTDDSNKLSFNSDAFRANNKSTRPMPKSITKKASGFKMKGYGRQK